MSTAERRHANGALSGSGENGRIVPDDIKAKLREIQGEATSAVEDAKSRMIAAVAVAGAVVVVGIYLLGRRAGRRRSTIIEITRR